MTGLEITQNTTSAQGRTAARDGRPIVLLGASHAAAWTVAGVAGHPVVNRGIPDDQTHGYVERFERDVAALRPCAVVIWGVESDITRATRGRTAEACWCAERNLEALVRRARAHRITPVLATELTLRPPARPSEWLGGVMGRLRGKEGYHQRVNGHILRLNTFIRDLARQAGVPLLDLQPLLSARNGMRARRYARLDGGRLTKAGYRVIDAYAGPLLEAWLAEPLPLQAPRVRAAGR